MSVGGDSHPFNVFCLAILDDSPAIKRRIDLENSTPKAKSTKLWSLTAFKRFVSNFTGLTEKSIINESAEKLDLYKSLIKSLFEKLMDVCPPWSAVVSGNVAGSEARAEQVIAHAVWLEALGVAARRIAFSPAHIESAGSGQFDWPVTGLINLNPDRQSPDWIGRCVTEGGRMQKNAVSTKRTADKIFEICQPATDLQLAS